MARIVVTLLLLTCFSLSAIFVGTSVMARDAGYICSPITGQLVSSTGTFAANTTVSRTWTYRGDTQSETVTTDSEGRFAFGAVPAKKGFFDWLAGEVVVDQTFSVELADGPFDFLRLFKRDLKMNSETKGAPFVVQCLTDSEPGKDDVQWGTCRLIE